MDKQRMDDRPPLIDRRSFVLAGLTASLGAAIPNRSRAAVAQPAIPILAYHRFDTATPGPTTVTIRTFEGQMRRLAEHGYRIASLRDAVGALRHPAEGTTPRTVITVDDGHRSVYALLFPLIREHRMPVTLFVYPSAISNADYAMTWGQLREMQASGLVEVQSHTYWHPNFRTERRRGSAASYRAFIDDQLQRSKHGCKHASICSPGPSESSIPTSRLRREAPAIRSGSPMKAARRHPVRTCSHCRGSRSPIRIVAHASMV